MLAVAPLYILTANVFEYQVTQCNIEHVIKAFLILHLKIYSSFSFRTFYPDQVLKNNPYAQEFLFS
jgi:hypothetical protein